jgi:hypothetical protein
MFKELDTVVLARDIPEYKLRKGDLGTVVFVHGGAASYEGRVDNAWGTNARGGYPAS